jgi:hypothetical protein
MNWLIYENKIKTNEGYELLKQLNQEEKNGINHGHTSDELISFIDHAEKKIDISNFYESKSYSQLNVEDIVKSGPQILLLQFNILPKKIFKRPMQDSSFENNFIEDPSPSIIIHYVFKLPASNGQIELIDPMQPTKKIVLSIKKEGEKILLGNEHYQFFGFTGITSPHEVQIVETVSRRD